jgi:hypothetical protein
MEVKTTACGPRSDVRSRFLVGGPSVDGLNSTVAVLSKRAGTEPRNSGPG